MNLLCRFIIITKSVYILDSVRSNGKKIVLILQRCMFFYSVYTINEKQCSLLNNN